MNVAQQSKATNKHKTIFTSFNCFLLLFNFRDCYLNFYGKNFYGKNFYGKNFKTLAYRTMLSHRGIENQKNHQSSYPQLFFILHIHQPCSLGPRFYISFAFTIIHGSRQPANRNIHRSPGIHSLICSVVLPGLVSCIVLQPPSFLCSPFIALCDVICMKQSGQVGHFQFVTILSTTGQLQLNNIQLVQVDLHSILYSSFASTSVLNNLQGVFTQNHASSQ